AWAIAGALPAQDASVAGQVAMTGTVFGRTVFRLCGFDFIEAGKIKSTRPAFFQCANSKSHRLYYGEETAEIVYSHNQEYLPVLGISIPSAVAKSIRCSCACMEISRMC